MQFSPLTVASLIIGPLRYFFKTYGAANNLQWDPDPNKTQLEIEYFNNLHKIPIQERPRILIDRGTYRIDKVGLSDNLMRGKPFSETQGLEDRVNMVLYSGTAQMTIEARQQGTCELLVDMATHFIGWSRPLICDSNGFKELGLPMQIGPCELQVNSEDDEKFQVMVNLPYIREEQWKIRNDGILMKALNVEVTNSINGDLLREIEIPVTTS
jgi:hypothetical protein